MKQGNNMTFISNGRGGTSGSSSYMLGEKMAWLSSSRESKSLAMGPITGLTGKFQLGEGAHFGHL